MQKTPGICMWPLIHTLPSQRVSQSSYTTREAPTTHQLRHALSTAILRYYSNNNSARICRCVVSPSKNIRIPAIATKEIFDHYRDKSSITTAISRCGFRKSNYAKIPW
jgi:hypothetical protein